MQNKGEIKMLKTILFRQGNEKELELLDKLNVPVALQATTREEVLEMLEEDDYLIVNTPQTAEALNLDKKVNLLALNAPIEDLRNYRKRFSEIQAIAYFLNCGNANELLKAEKTNIKRKKCARVDFFDRLEAKYYNQPGVLDAVSLLRNKKRVTSNSDNPLYWYTAQLIPWAKLGLSNKAGLMRQFNMSRSQAELLIAVTENSKEVQDYKEAERRSAQERTTMSKYGLTQYTFKEEQPLKEQYKDIILDSID